MSIFKPENPILQKTEDGSHTLYLQQLNETYHSSSGAITESSHVYINHGYNKVDYNGLIKILEVGFGTGMNTILTLLESQKKNHIVEYHSLEPYPIPLDLLELMDMGYISQQTEYKEKLIQLHRQDDDTLTIYDERFSFTRWKKTIQEFKGLTQTFDLIYFDAFAPRKQPEIWDIFVLEKCVNLLKEGGIFITYCANGQFKRNLKTLKMKVFNPPGIGLRREITMAIK